MAKKTEITVEIDQFKHTFRKIRDRNLKTSPEVLNCEE